MKQEFGHQPLAFDQPQRFESGIGIFRTASKGQDSDKIYGPCKNPTLKNQEGQACKVISDSRQQVSGLCPTSLHPHLQSNDTYAFFSLALVFAIVFYVLWISGAVTKSRVKEWTIWIWGTYQPTRATHPRLRTWYVYHIRFFKGSLPFDSGLAQHILPAFNFTMETQKSYASQIGIID